MANAEIRRLRRQDAPFGPAGIGTDPVGSISGALQTLFQLASKIPGNQAFASPIQSGGDLGKQVGKEFGPAQATQPTSQQTPQQMLAEQAKKIALQTEKKRLQQELESGAVQPEQVIEQAEQMLSQRLAGQNNQASSGVMNNPQAPVQEDAFSGAPQLESGGSSRGFKDKLGGAGNTLQTLLTMATGIPTPGFMRTFGDVGTDIQIDRANRVPLSRAKREEMAIQGGISALKDQALKEQERAQKFFDDVLRDKPLGGSDSKFFNLASGGLESLQAIDLLFTQDPSNLRNLNRPGNPVGQQLTFLRNDLENSLLRIESGAVISNDEKKFIRELTTPQGIQAYLQDPDTVRLKIETIRGRLEGFKNSMKPNEQIRQTAKTLLQQGFSETEIFEAFRRKGMII